MRRIVVGYNGSEACRVALSRAAAIAGKASCPLDIVTSGIPVAPVGGFGWVAPYETARPTEELIQRRVDEARALVEPALEVATHAVLGNAARELAEVAKRTEASLIVIGSAKHTTFERIVLGSTADRAVRLAPVPCLIAADAALARRILVAADDSPYGKHVLEAALDLAAVTGAVVRCLHVVNAPPVDVVVKPTFDMASYVDDLTRHFEKFVGDTAAAAGGPTPETTVRVGVTGDEILAECESFEADLVAVGSHGRGFVARAILGSISEHVLRHAPCSVLVATGLG